uniref:Btz domain-containing protein n=1 Tax=Parascaris univalens TaxID=6257 RepID=A0A915AL35_PARUN
MLMYRHRRILHLEKQISQKTLKKRMPTYFGRQSSRFSSFPSDSFASAQDMYWRNMDRSSSGPGLRGVDSLRSYSRAPTYEGDMRFDNRYDGGERMSEWEMPYSSHISQMMPSYDVGENESWRPAREEGSWRDLRQDRRDDGYRNRDTFERRARLSASPQRHRCRSSNERRESFDARHTLNSHGVYDGEKSSADSYQRADIRSCRQIDEPLNEQRLGVKASKNEHGISSATKDSKESIAKAKKNVENEELKRREEDEMALGAAIENDGNSGATRKSTSSRKEDETVENANEEKGEKGDAASDNETAQVFGKVEVGKEEDPSKKIFIRKDFTHDDIHHFVPISISGRGRSRGGSSVYATKGKRWVDEWKERNAVLKAAAVRNIRMRPPSDVPEYKQGACISGDEMRYDNVETDSVGIIDPKDYIEELSNPDLDAPQNEDLVKGRRALLSPPMMAEVADDRAGIGFFSVPVLAGPSMFRAREKLELERPFKPGLLDPPRRSERPMKPGLLDARRDISGPRNGPLSTVGPVTANAVAEAMRATVDAIADSLPQRGDLSEAVKRGVTEILLSNDGFTAEIAKLCKEEIAKMLTRGMYAEGLTRRAPVNDLGGPSKRMPSLEDLERRTPLHPGSYGHEGPSPPYVWERNGEPYSIDSRRGLRPAEFDYELPRGYEGRLNYDGPRTGVLMDFDEPPRNGPPSLEEAGRDRSPVARVDGPRFMERERFGGLQPRRREFDEGPPFDRSLSGDDEFGRPSLRERRFRGHFGRGRSAVRGFCGALRGRRDAWYEPEGRPRDPGSRNSEHSFGRWGRTFEEPHFERRRPR